MSRGCSLLELDGNHIEFIIRGPANGDDVVGSCAEPFPNYRRVGNFGDQEYSLAEKNTPLGYLSKDWVDSQRKPF